MSKSPSLRRIQADIRELAIDPSDQYAAAPLENDMFECTLYIGPNAVGGSAGWSMNADSVTADAEAVAIKARQ
eukprot:scaffold1772_cov185-Alexandrium_tamarense.AAC.10